MGQIQNELHEQARQLKQERADLEHRGELIESAMRALDVREQEQDELSDDLYQAAVGLPSERTTCTDEKRRRSDFVSPEVADTTACQTSTDHYADVSMPTEAILTRQTTSLLDVAVSGGELRRVLTGGADNTLRIWDLATREMTRVFNTGCLICACWLSFDGRRGSLLCRQRTQSGIRQLGPHLAVVGLGQW